MRDAPRRMVVGFAGRQGGRGWAAGELERSVLAVGHGEPTDRERGDRDLMSRKLLLDPRLETRHEGWVDEASTPMVDAGVHLGASRPHEEGAGGHRHEIGQHRVPL
jgi:hypothetical protein